MKACDAHDQERGKGSQIVQWKKNLTRLLLLPSTYACLLLIVIACALIFMPSIPPNAKDFLMVAFACIAMLPRGDLT